MHTIVVDKFISLVYISFENERTHITQINVVSKKIRRLFLLKRPVAESDAGFHNWVFKTSASLRPPSWVAWCHVGGVGLMVRASDLRSSGRGFDSRSGRYQVTTLGKLFTPMCLCHQAV